MLASILTIAALSVVSPLAVRWLRAMSGWALAAGPLGVFAYFAMEAPEVFGGAARMERSGWVEGLGAALSFRLDGLSLLFALLITGIGSLVIAYAGGYLRGDARLGRLQALLFLFMASMLGLVLADNVVTLFVFWELTSVTSFLLIGFDHERAAARRAAVEALVVTGLGGLCLLAGLILMATASGSWELHEILTRGDQVRASGLYPAALALVLLGACTKSAQAPFHFWLPDAMEAPTPISAYLHSATMVKAGVYLLARTSEALGGTQAWTISLTVIGGATMVVGGLLATRETQFKRALAYTTVSALGTLVMLIGVGTEKAMIAMAAFLLAHAMYKGTLFLVAGIVDHEAGEKDAAAIGGLWRRMPLVAVVAAAAALSMAGVIPTFGFIAKEIALGASLKAPWWSIGAAVMMVIGAAANVAAALVVGVLPFVGRARGAAEEATSPGPALWIGPAALALLGLALGLAPHALAEGIISSSAGAARGGQVEAHLHLWHGFTLEFWLSGAALAIGVVIVLIAGFWRRMTTPIGVVFGAGPGRVYDGALGLIQGYARAQTMVLQNGRLHNYLAVTIAASAGLVIWALIRHGEFGPIVWGDWRPLEVTVVAMICIGAVASARAKGRLGAVAALGVVGYGVTVIYLLFGAPDLAMTQVAVETLTVILFVLVLYHLPRFATYSGRARRAADFVIALAVGVTMTTVTLLASSESRGKPISEWFLANAYPEGKGRNIVNVILVDFRSIDTMGEITVLAIAALGVSALLKLRAGRRASS